ncbi:MAG: hypothetical protein Fur0040_03470 [Sideroxydans sp.]
MNAVTQCPSCQTRFRVNAEQLSVRDGMVRCGRCGAAFDARWHLQESEPSPQLDLPIDPIDEPDALPSALLTVPESPGDPDLSPRLEQEALADPQPELSPVLNFDALAAPVVEPTPPQEAPTPSRWPWVVASMAGALMLALQSVYFYRTELAAQWPGSKPLLVQSCQWLGCSIGLPRQIEHLSIEASELEAVPGQGNRITLHALLRNRSGHTQAWPSLELTLTDLRDQVIARRAFHPADYLQDKAALSEGMGRNREQEIALRLDTSDLRPSGYRLLLFYPAER